jgi:flagellar basal body rod protein FlgC
MSPISSSGVTAFNHAADRLGRAASDLAQQAVNPNANVVGDMVSLNLAQSGASTAVALVRTSDEMQKSLLDILA